MFMLPRQTPTCKRRWLHQPLWLCTLQLTAVHSYSVQQAKAWTRHPNNAGTERMHDCPVSALSLTMPPFARVMQAAAIYFATPNRYLHLHAREFHWAFEPTTCRTPACCKRLPCHHVTLRAVLCVSYTHCIHLCYHNLLLSGIAEGRGWKGGVRARRRRGGRGRWTRRAT